MTTHTEFLADKRIVTKTVFLDLHVQKDLISRLVCSGYDATHEGNGFVRLEKTNTFFKPK